MDPTVYGPEENVNRVACLDAYLQVWEFMGVPW